MCELSLLGSSGTELRRDLRSIIKALYRREALFTLEEANALIRAIPRQGPLDNRDAEEAEIIAMFNSPETEEAPVTPTQYKEIASSNAPEVPDTQGETVSAQPVPDPPSTAMPVPGAEFIARTQRRKHLWWYIASIAAALILILAFVLAQSFSSRQNCSPLPNGVTLYTDINYQGQCHTFGPGDYELTHFGLDQNVSSINDAHNAYSIRLLDKAKNFFNLDKSIPILPAEWDKRADTIHIEKHRLTTCSPGNNGSLWTAACRNLAPGDTMEICEPIHKT